VYRWHSPTASGRMSGHALLIIESRTVSQGTQATEPAQSLHSIATATAAPESKLRFLSHTASAPTERVGGPPISHAYRRAFHGCCGKVEPKEVRSFDLRPFAFFAIYRDPLGRGKGIWNIVCGVNKTPKPKPHGPRRLPECNEQLAISDYGLEVTGGSRHVGEAKVVYVPLREVSLNFHVISSRQRAAATNR